VKYGNHLSEYVAQWGNVSAAKLTLVLKPPPKMVTFEQPQHFGDSNVRMLPNRLAADESRSTSSAANAALTSSTAPLLGHPITNVRLKVMWLTRRVKSGSII
jgi:hypothetical protein